MAKLTKSKSKPKGLISNSKYPRRNILLIIALFLAVGLGVTLISSAGVNYHTLAYCPKPHPTLRLTNPHMKSNCVRYLQSALNAKAGGSHGLVIDGDFGSGTKSAVVSFQRAHGLGVDGVVGTNTWAKLDALVPPSAGPTPRPTANGSAPKTVASIGGAPTLKACYLTGKQYVGSSLVYGKIRYISSNPNTDSRHAGSRNLVNYKNGANLAIFKTGGAMTATETNVDPNRVHTFINDLMLPDGHISASYADEFTIGTLPRCS